MREEWEEENVVFLSPSCSSSFRWEEIIIGTCFSLYINRTISYNECNWERKNVLVLVLLLLLSLLIHDTNIDCSWIRYLMADASLVVTAATAVVNLSPFDSRWFKQSWCMSKWGYREKRVYVLAGAALLWYRHSMCASYLEQVKENEATRAQVKVYNWLTVGVNVIICRVHAGILVRP